MKVVIEPQITEHDPGLYRSEAVASSIDGFRSLDEGARAFYDEQGYVLVRKGFSQDLVDRAKDTLKSMCHEGAPRCDSVYYEGTIRRHLAEAATDHRPVDQSGASAKLAMGHVGDSIPRLPADIRARYLRKFMGFTRAYDALGAISQHPDLLAAAATLSGGTVREFQDMAMIKPPGGREKPWHQDHAYFNLPLDTRIVGVWIALDHVSPENGCMYLMAGAHKQGPRVHFMRRDWQICDTDIYGCRYVCAPMEAGAVLLFDAKLPHGTPTNRSDEYRWALQLHYIPTSVQEIDEQVRLEIFGSEGKNVTC
jgi:phytanoyl-CoA hydroxylase